MFRPLLFLCLLIVALPMLACGDDGALSRVCDTNADCERGERCLAGFCATGSLRACSQDEDCPGGWRCEEAGFCRAEPGRESRLGCAGAADCDTLEVCIGAACRVRDCQGDEECPVDSLCVGTLCRYAEICSDDEDCRSGRCGEEGRCIAGCTTNADCGGGAETLCEEGACLRTCTTDTSCRPGQRCVDDFCVTEECRGFSTEGCPDGQRCDGRGRCTMVTSCSAPEECAETERCVDGFCEAGRPCTRDAECDFLEGAFCTEGRCAQARECSAVGAPCLPSETCANGFCLPGGCLSDADCLANQMCDAGRCALAPSQDAVASLRILPATPWFQAQRPDASSAWSVISLDADAMPLNPARLEVMLRVEPADAGFSVARVPGTLDRFVLRADAPAAPPSSDQMEPDDAPLPLRLVATMGPLEAQRALSAPSSGAEPGALRIQVIDAADRSPIPDAQLLFDNADLPLDASGGAWVVPGSRRNALLEVRAEGYRDLALFPPSDPQAELLLLPLRALEDELPLRVRSERIEASTGSSAGFHGIVSPRDLSDFDLAGLLGTAQVVEADLSTLGDPILSLPAHLLLRLDFLGIGTLRRETALAASPTTRAVWSLGATPSPEALFALFANENDRDLPSLIASAVHLLSRPHYGLLPESAFDARTRPRSALTQAATRPAIPRIIDLPETVDRQRALLVYVVEHPWLGPIPLGIVALPETGPALLLHAAPDGGLQRSPRSLLLIEPDPGEGVFGDAPAREGAGTAARRISAPPSRTRIDLRNHPPAPRLQLQDDELLVLETHDDPQDAGDRLLRIEATREGRPVDIYLVGQTPSAQRVALAPFMLDAISTARLWELPPASISDLKQGHSGLLSEPAQVAERWFILRSVPETGH